MALRNQPYLPLYIQDFLTDEKLMECSSSATGIYIRIMCVMHKSEEYGTILLKQKDKQCVKQDENFAYKIAKYMPYSFDEILAGLSELINEGVLQIDGDKLIQKRMIRDNYISIERGKAGKKGGEKTQKFAKAKNKANTENEIENENVIVIDIKKGGAGEKIDFIDRIVHSFKDQYENVNNIDYSILNKGKEREAAGKLLSQYKKRHPEADSEQALTALDSYFAACVRIKDGWYRDNMSLPIIISKFNAINKILRDGKSRTNPGISDQEFSELIKSM